MRETFTILPRILIGLGAGGMLAGGVVAFISVIGIVPLMSYRTKTEHYAIFYENAIAAGGIIGAVLSMWPIEIKIPAFFLTVFGFAAGNFAGVLIIALAEVLDVMPIMNRRVKLKKGIALIVYAFAAGKLVGALYYYLYPIFLELID
ncbi:stage V sporulation protein AB [Cellulosilyticum ruminicola]|uniref:stage V sporulation protein AB n=1 Tax=Cellulosilyticum ruminicola TaxID=425254 RepID=UPI0006CF2584|nr:stage V sporulation protein AB [Cellulosilyticum ruminicola]